MPDQPHLIVEACTGYTATQPDAERAAYVERLSEKLRDPEFRKIEGFPIGDDEAILALSDPPYYTACPNPFLCESAIEMHEPRVPLLRPLIMPQCAFRALRRPHKSAADRAHWSRAHR
jgi:hypothetical protein